MLLFHKEVLRCIIYFVITPTKDIAMPDPHLNADKPSSATDEPIKKPPDGSFDAEFAEEEPEASPSRLSWLWSGEGYHHTPR